MMKQVITTILAILYLATSAGATVIVHHCMGQVVSRGFVKKDKCGKCGMEKKKEGCCEDKEQVIKSPQDNHSFQAPHIEFMPFVVALPADYVTFVPKFIFTTPVITTHNNSPPGCSGIPLFIRNCVFRL